jgi:hypothetical protein
MLASIAMRVATACVLASTIPPASGPRRPANAINDALAALTASVDGVDRSVVQELRGVSRCVTSVAEALQVLVGCFADLEGRLDHARRRIEADSSTEIDDELFNRLARRLGIWQAREALQRLEEAHPDAPASNGDPEDQAADHA